MHKNKNANSKILILDYLKWTGFRGMNKNINTISESICRPPCTEHDG